jgi:hypothetical protein
LLAAASAISSTPFTVPGGNPVTDVPGNSPRFPVTTVGPVFVIVELASNPYVVALPNGPDGTTNKFAFV